MGRSRRAHAASLDIVDAPRECISHSYGNSGVAFEYLGAIPIISADARVLFGSTSHAENSGEIVVLDSFCAVDKCNVQMTKSK